MARRGTGQRPIDPPAREAVRLLHELVHHVQDLGGRFAAIDSPYRRRQAKEREAYAVQRWYLVQMGVARRFVAEDAVAAICRDTDAAMDEAVPRQGPAGARHAHRAGSPGAPIR